MIIDHLITADGFELFALNDAESHARGCEMARGRVAADWAWRAFGRDCLRRYRKAVKTDYPAGITEEAFIQALASLRVQFARIISEE